MEDPIALFGRWYRDALGAGFLFPDAMALATADRTGAVSVRMVLLKGFDDRGFVFHTNYGSRKARHLDANPHAALAFYWGELDRQVRIEGRARRLPADESDAYFATRPVGSRLAAWSSRQSEVMASRVELEDAYEEAARRFEGADVPRPSFWGGYRVVPHEIEFWTGRADRLHDRVRYRRDGSAWRADVLYP